MKKFIQIISVLSLAVVVMAASANAQSTAKINVAIPFDFSVGSKVVKAGAYDVKVRPNTAGVATVTFTDSTGHNVKTVVAIQNGSEAIGKAQLVFDVSNGGHALSQVIIDRLGLSVPAARNTRNQATAKIASAVRVPLASN